MNPLQQERENSTIEAKDVINFIDSDPKWTKAKQSAYQLIERDPYLILKNPFEMNKDEALEKTMTQIRRAVKVRNSIKDPLLLKGFDMAMAQYDRSFSMRIGVHFGLFKATIKEQGTQEQWNKYKDDIETMKIIGCFAMTELGTSSYLRGSETTATFDEENDEFIIDSPTLTSTKFWIGMAGNTATHSVVLCNLIIKKEKKGLYWFLVPLRSQNTGKLNPGISAGSVGSKSGRHGLDSGYIQFTHVRIPRENMLMKWACVKKTGEFISPKNMALSYLTLISERIMFLNLTYYTTSQALTIAVRYSFCRNQNGQKIIDFQSQQFRLINALSMVYSNILVAKEITKQWENAQELQFNPETQIEFVTKLKDFHAISSGLKCWITWSGTEILETCRRSMGGHAYSAYTGISTLIEDFGVATTGGGDNVVMAQQHVKILLSYLLKPKRGSEFEYLTTKQSNVELKNFDRFSIMNSFSYLSSLLLKNIGMNLKKEKSLKESWNNNLVDIIECSKINSLFFILKLVNNSIINISLKLKSTFSKLIFLYSLYNLYIERALFLQFKILKPNQVDEILNLIFLICNELKNDVVVLVDAFDLPDFIIKSEFGKFDGNIYENYFNKIKSNL
eukprot:gene4627-8200_t